MSSPSRPLRRLLAKPHPDGFTPYSTSYRFINAFGDAKPEEQKQQVEEEDDPTGLDDLNNVVARYASGGDVSDEDSITKSASEDTADKEAVSKGNSSKDAAYNDIAKVADAAEHGLIDIIKKFGSRIGGGIMILRALDKIFTAWNSLIKSATFLRYYYKKDAMGALGSEVLYDSDFDSVYRSVGRLCVDLFVGVECSIARLAEFQKGIDKVRVKIIMEVDKSRETEEGEEAVVRITKNAIVLEHELDMLEAANGVNLALPKESALPKKTTLPKRETLPKKTSLTKKTVSKTSRPIAASVASGTYKPRPGYAHWTEKERLELLKVWRDYPRESCKNKLALFRLTLPTPFRTDAAIQCEHSRLKRMGTTVDVLESKLAAAQDSEEQV